MTDYDIQLPRAYPNWYAASMVIIRAAFTLLSRYRVEGVENIPAEGGCLLVLNHLSMLDSPLIYVSSPRPLFNFGAAEYQDRFFLGFAMRVGRAIFVNRDQFDKEAIKMALNVLEQGHPLIMSIEGTRSKTGGLGPGKSGAAYLATRAGVPIIPAALWGMEKFAGSLKHFRREEVVCRFGEPISLPAGRARGTQLDDYTEQIMTTLAAMLPPSYRGMYADHPLTIEKLANAR